MAYDELGQLIQGPASAPTAQQGGGWTAALSDPVTRAGLLATGLQLMTGGWGNGTQQLAQALGAGASAAGATAQSLQQEERYQEGLDQKTMDRASREREAALNRDSRAEIANIQNAGRMEVAQTRVQGMMDRARLIHQPNGQAEVKFYNDQLKEARKTIEGDIGSLKLDQASREDMIKAKALERLNEARQRGLFGAQGQGTIDQAITPQRQGAAPAPATPGSPRPWETVKGTPEVQEALKTAAGRNRLIKAYPNNVREIMQNAPDIYNIRD